MVEVFDDRKVDSTFIPKRPLVFGLFLDGRAINRVYEDFTGKVVCGPQNFFTLKNGVLHSFNDEPSEVRGSQRRWHTDGKLNRRVGPAIAHTLTNTYNFSPYYLDGFLVKSYQEYFDSLTDEERIIMLLQRD